MGDREGGRGCFFYGCIVSVVLMVLFVGGIAAIYFYGKAEVGPHCEEYIQLVEAGKYKESYEAIGQAWKNTQSYEEYVEFETAVHKALGKYKDMTMSNVNIQANTQGTFATLVYSADFENGPCTIKFSLIKENGKWVVQGVNYQSPAILKALKCPHCSKTNTSMGKFCASCGKTMKVDKADEVKVDKVEK